jgi:hypothetical protein
MHRKRIAAEELAVRMAEKKIFALLNIQYGRETFLSWFGNGAGPFTLANFKIY